MASLALLVCLIIIGVLFIGPACYILSSFRWMPDWIIWILSLISIMIGIWFLLLPLPMVRFIGCIPILFGVKSFRKKGNSHPE